MTTVRIPRGVPRVQYRGDGRTAAFPFPFPVFASEDLEVWFGPARQTTGYAVTGAGETAGGTVTFAAAPADGTLVLLTRRVPIERMTDFRESGPLPASALNRELDTLTACLQQVAADQERMLRYADNDPAAGAVLPGRNERAGRILCFDGSGAPTVRAPVDEEALSTYVAPGVGGIRRSVRDKLADAVSVKDFGAVGDGLADDTTAIQAALAAAPSVRLPAGIYRVSATLTLRRGGALRGEGQTSVLRAASRGIDAVHLADGYATLADFRIENAKAGVRLFGRDGPCVQNALSDLGIWDCDCGLVLDGYTSPDRPCYWNNFARILIARPALHGVWLTRSGAGDTPNANRFQAVRVYSLSAPMTGSGFFVEQGKYNNTFADCEANLWPQAAACFRVGANADKNLFVNVYAESLGSVPNVQLDAGSVETAIVNLFSASAGPAILDRSGGAFTAVNAGYPEKNRLARTRVSELVVEALRYDTEYVEPAAGGTVDLSPGASVYLVSSYGGAVTARLPSAASVNGHTVTVKKTDASANPITITEIDGAGPDRRSIVLGNRFDYVTAVSNGAGWWVVGASAMPGNAAFREGLSLIEPDLTQTLYLVSAWGGAAEVRLPAPGAPHAVGRTVTIKKSDQSANAVTVTQAGGGGPDNEKIRLTAFGHAVTAMSNGAGWHILGRNP